MIGAMLRSAAGVLRRSAATPQLRNKSTASPATLMDAHKPQVASRMSEAEWDLRVDLAAAYRLADMHGWTDLLGTHISVRVPTDPGAGGSDGADEFLINPYGVLFDEVTASSLVKVDASGAILDAGSGGYGINPAGFVIHSAVHMGRADVACALHTHTVAGTAVATQTGGLLPLTHHAMKVVDHAAYHDYEGISTALDERERIVASLADGNVLFMRNHGLLAVGRSVGEAFVWMFRAQRACEMQLALQTAGVPVEHLSDEVQQVTSARNKKANSPSGHRPIGKLEWPALVRKLDRIDPSYRE